MKTLDEIQNDFSTFKLAFESIREEGSSKKNKFSRSFETMIEYYSKASNEEKLLIRDFLLESIPLGVSRISWFYVKTKQFKNSSPEITEVLKQIFGEQIDFRPQQSFVQFRNAFFNSKKDKNLQNFLKKYRQHKPTESTELNKYQSEIKNFLMWHGYASLWLDKISKLNDLKDLFEIFNLSPSPQRIEKIHFQELKEKITTETQTFISSSPLSLSDVAKYQGATKLLDKEYQKTFEKTFPNSTDSSAKISTDIIHPVINPSFLESQTKFMSSLVSDTARNKENQECNFQRILEGETIVKTFNLNSYTGPRILDFQRRAMIIKYAIEDWVNGLNDCPGQKLFKTQLNAYLQEYLEHLEKIGEMTANTTEDEYIQKIWLAMELIKEFISKTKEIDPVFKPYLAKDGFIKVLEDTFTASLKRENFKNIYQVELEHKVENRYSHSISIGHVIPSTMRGDIPDHILEMAKKSGNNLAEGDQIILPNFIQVRCGGHSQQEQPDFMGYRHSSFPPIQLKDQEERQKRAKQALLQMLKTMVKNRQEIINPNEQPQPITINVFSLSLLSSIIIDKYFLKNESESIQMKDVATIYEELDKKPIEIDGIKYKFNLFLMNAPLNPHGESLKKSVLTSDGRIIEKCKQQLVSTFGKDITNKLRTIGIISSFEPKNTPSRNNEEDRDIYTALFLSLNADPTEENKKIILQLILYFETFFMLEDPEIPAAEYGVRFLLLGKALGAEVDFFCKSGEDRTGRMMNLIEEMQIFKQTYGRYPKYQYDEEKKRYLFSLDDQNNMKSIANQVLKFSTSQDICDANGLGARGLQINDATLTMRLKTNEGLPVKVHDAMGKLAKGVYRDPSGKMAKRLNAIKSSKNSQQSLSNYSKDEIDSNSDTASIFSESSAEYDTRTFSESSEMLEDIRSDILKLDLTNKDNILDESELELDSETKDVILNAPLTDKEELITQLKNNILNSSSLLEIKKSLLSIIYLNKINENHNQQFLDNIIEYFQKSENLIDVLEQYAQTGEVPSYNSLIDNEAEHYQEELLENTQNTNTESITSLTPLVTDTTAHNLQTVTENTQNTNTESITSPTQSVSNTTELNLQTVTENTQ
ncbi:MAG: hypothetical protein QG556_986, partial [Pseudomonadota bacterium]|nr:hypothetical protein [Pseudomonadota bacterium]